LKAQLPLSWSHKSLEYPKFDVVKLQLSGLPWIYNAEIPSDYDIKCLCDELETKFDQGFLLRGCRTELATYLNNKGYKIIRTGAEGVIDLQSINDLPESVSSLVKRGEKYGEAVEITLSDINRKRVSTFIKKTPYALKPKLKYLFNTSFDSNTRCFVMSTSVGNWLGVITVSFSSPDSCHAEMILREKNAPVGVMEFLLSSVMNILKEEGYIKFSLGEVPFVTPDSMDCSNLDPSLVRSLQEFLLFKSGHLLRYAFNYRGLFNFKNKFNPDWQPVYICTTSKAPFLSLIDLFYKTGYLELSRKELLSNLIFSSP